jgi:thioredoxin reductase (NADPH)
MAERAAILIVDDEPAALAAMLDALTRRFGADYRIAPHLSADAALQAVAAMKKDGEEIALVIADQWMPEMTGTELLGHIHSIEPAAKRALLVTWGDHSASPTILEGCSLGRLDNYLYKPWSPAEVHLYPFVSEFLSEWTQLHRPAMELIHIVGDERTPRSSEIRELLERNGIPFGFHDSASAEAKRLAEEPGVELNGSPAVFLLDGSILFDPTDTQIMDAVGTRRFRIEADLNVRRMANLLNEIIGHPAFQAVSPHDKCYAACRIGEINRCLPRRVSAADDCGVHAGTQSRSTQGRIEDACAHETIDFGNA